MKSLKYAIILIVAALLAFFSYKLYKKIKKKAEIENNVKTLQQFSFIDITNNKPFSNKELKQDTISVFIIFNTDCEHCQYEATEISKNNEQFKNAQILFISYEEIKTIKTFAEKYKLNNISNIHVLKTSTDALFKTFGSLSIPSIYIYDKNDKLLKNYKGEAKPEAIIKYLK